MMKTPSHDYFTKLLSRSNANQEGPIQIIQYNSVISFHKPTILVVKDFNLEFVILWRYFRSVYNNDQILLTYFLMVYLFKRSDECHFRKKW